ncbi:MAG: mechanosensitive ion channel family protein [Caldisericia bacterium]|nr:mechanosensitive ion channel family protein [Caldisericia bacterium]
MNFFNIPFFDNTVLGNTLANYLWFFVVLIFGFFVSKLLIQKIILKRISNHVKKTSIKWDDTAFEIINKALQPMLNLLVLYISLQFINFPTSFEIWINRIFFATTVIFITKSICSIVEVSITKSLISKYSEQKSSENFNGLIQIVEAFIWTLSFLVVLNYFGVNVSALIASIGIVGLAVAMAAKGIVEDIICYFTIIIDKPFEVGDYMSVCEENGTLISIGLASSRMKSLSGEEIVISNSKLINNIVQNYKKMVERRVSFQVGIIYETPVSVVEKIPQLVKDTFTNKKNTRFGRCHFNSFGDFSLNFSIVYFIQSGDYDEYMDIQQSINIDIMKAFEDNGIGFAYPTQLVYTQKTQN